MFILFLLTPQIINSILDYIGSNYLIFIPFRMDTKNWYQIMAIAFPCALSYIVIKQSEIQQKENELAQKRLEEMNQQLLDLQLKSNLGYLLPNYNSEKNNHPYDNQIMYTEGKGTFIKLINAGDDDIFVLAFKETINGVVTSDTLSKPLYLSKSAAFNNMLFECHLTEENHEEKFLDIVIEIEIKNMRGYRYRQILYMGFENKNSLYSMEKFNMEIRG